MPPKDMTGSLASAKTVEAFSAIAKVIAYIVTFSVLLTSAVIAKGTLLFMTSQIKLTKGEPDVQHEYCSKRIYCHMKLLGIEHNKDILENYAYQ